MSVKTAIKGLEQHQKRGVNRREWLRMAAIGRSKPIAKHNRKRKGIRKPHWESRAVKPARHPGWDVRRTNWVYPVGPGSCKGDRSNLKKVPLWTVMFSPAEVERRQAKEAA